MNLASIILMAQPGGGASGSGSSSWYSFLPLILIVVVFYLFFIRPQMKRSKSRKNSGNHWIKGKRSSPLAVSTGVL